MRNLHSEITAKILAQLKTGVAPWRRPWTKRAGVGELNVTFPRNATTGKFYSGVNVLLLWGKAQDCGFNNPRWLTFKQAKEHGGSVRKGEKGTEIVYVNFIERADRSNPDKTARIPFLKSYHVFNVDQCDGLPAKLLEGGAARVVETVGERNEIVDAFLASTGATIRHGGDRAFYTTGGDYVQMPPLAAFTSTDAYYAVLFHELGHWTGNASRLNRTFGARFGDRAYAIEELVAELTSAFVCAEFGIDMGAAPAAYLDSWLKGAVAALEAHEGAIVTAASKASKAVEFMRGLASAEGDDVDAIEPVLEAA